MMSSMVTFGIILMCSIIAAIYLIIGIDNEKGTNPKPMQAVLKDEETSREDKLILLYTTFYGDPNNFLYSKLNIPKYSEFCGCANKNCNFTNDKKLFSKSDAVIFHSRDFSGDMLHNRNFWLNLLNRPRKSTQVWVYSGFENPFYTPSAGTFYDMFNLTFTYRFESDIFRSKERFRLLQPSEYRPDPHINYAQTKTKQVAWIVRHCGLLRDKVCRKLQSLGVRISRGGGCTHPLTMKCSDRNCIKERKKYKFYFSAENNFCKDYITEKYWDNPFLVDQVPIVFGGANYTKLGIPGSFIDALSFKSPKALANYIIYLDGNDTAYNEYFNWKQKYKLIFENDDKKGCHYIMYKLCEILNNRNYAYKKIDLRKFSVKEECVEEEKRAEKWYNQS